VNDSEYAVRWRILRAQLSELERNAGVSDAANHLRDTAAGSEPPEHPEPLPLDAAKRRDLRALYFSVSHEALRGRLIAKQRELELFERTRVRVRLEDARRHLESIRRRPSEGWWIAAIVGATLVIVGYWLFAVAGAIAAGVAALFVGNGIEQAARRRFEQAITFAEEDVSETEVAADTAQESADLFSERESATGQPDRSFEAAAELSAKTI
jgi:hypothetical protein